MTSSRLQVEPGVQSTRPSIRFIALLVSLTLLSLVPIWAFRYFPTTDGPSHLENAYILRHWLDIDCPYHRIYDLNLKPHPNWATHLALAVFLLAVPPLMAEKLLLTGYVIVFVASIGYFLRSVGQDRLLHILLAFPLIHNYCLQMGFYNFAFSLPLAFFVIGFWWRRRERPFGWNMAIALNLLLVLLYFFHIVSTLLALASVLVLGALHRKRVGRTASFAAALLPSCVLPLYFVLTCGVMSSSDGLPDGGTAFLTLSVLRSHDPRSAWIGIALAVLYGALIVLTLVLDKIGFGRKTPVPRIGLEDGLLLLALAFSLLYFIMPENISGGGYLRHRLALFPFLMILPWLTVRHGRFLRFMVASIAVLLTILQVILPLGRFEKLSAGLTDYVSGVSLMGPGDTVLPLNFFTHVGLKKSRISTYLHAVGYCTAAGAMGLDNYEARTEYFPLRYREGRNPSLLIGGIEDRTGHVHPERYPMPVDWILVRYPRSWNSILPRILTEHPEVRWILKHYEAVHKQGQVWLFKRKPGSWPPS